MNKFYYSASTNLILWSSLKDEYEKNNEWPDDAMELTNDQAAEFMNEPPEGKMRAAGNDGFPVWLDVPPPKHEELIAYADAQKQYLIVQANDYMNSKQWPGKAAIGRLKSDELAQYNLWLDYLDALEAVDTSSAPDINWPVPPGV